MFGTKAEVNGVEYAWILFVGGWHLTHMKHICHNHS
jgi:hypothetical protein